MSGTFSWRGTCWSSWMRHHFSEIVWYGSLSLLEWAEVVFNGLLNVRHLIALSGIDACAGPYKNSQDRRGAELCHHIPSQKTFEEGRTEHTSTLNWGRGKKTVSKERKQRTSLSQMTIQTLFTFMGLIYIHYCISTVSTAAV